MSTLGTAPGVRLLSILATASAATEIALSPLIGGLTDSVGRKPVLVSTVSAGFVVTLAAAIFPSVPLVALSKFVSSLVIGVFFLSGGAILADNLRDEPAKLAAASGTLFAVVNGGFGLGVALSEQLPSNLHLRYGFSAAVSLLGVALSLLVTESIAKKDRVQFQLRSFNPIAFTRLFFLGRKMRLLACLAALTLAPLFMGDTLQVYSMSQWKFSAVQVSQLFTGIAVSGVIANSVGGVLIKRIGLQLFTAVATLSTLLFWAGFSSGKPRVAILCAALGLLGPARTLGATTTMTTEGARLGIPQGQLSGDRANMVAWLKVLGPVMYGSMYLRGLAVGLPQAPFFFNCLLTLAALLLGPAALAVATHGSTDKS